jgi:hypothetical protein
MENAPIDSGVAQTAAPAPTPAPVQTPAPTPAPATAPTTPVMADGGTTSSSGIGGFFSQLNWLEVFFAVGGVAALAWVIYYYRFKLKQDKMINNELQRQIDEIKMNVQSTMKEKYKSI